VISVSLVLPEEKDGLPHSAKEANLFMYVFFKGELAIMDHDRCCYFCFTQLLWIMTGVVTFALLSLLDVLLLQYCVKIETMYTGERTPEIIKKKKTSRN